MDGVPEPDVHFGDADLPGVKAPTPVNQRCVACGVAIEATDSGTFVRQIRARNVITWVPRHQVCPR